MTLTISWKRGRGRTAAATEPAQFSRTRATARQVPAIERFSRNMTPCSRDYTPDAEAGRPLQSHAVKLRACLRRTTNVRQLEVCTPTARLRTKLPDGEP